MAHNVKLEKGIPIPPVRRTAPKHPILKMEVGDSFAVPFTPARPPYFHAVARRHGIKLATRRIGNTLRVWRIA